jgi:hypothetical protein
MAVASNATTKVFSIVFLPIVYAAKTFH